GDDERSEGVASPDTPLAFPEDDEHAEAAAAAAVEDAAKATAQDKVSRRAARSAPARLPPPIRPASIPISCSSLTSPSVQWAQEQRGVVASLSHENAHLLKVRDGLRLFFSSSFELSLFCRITWGIIADLVTRPPLPPWIGRISSGDLFRNNLDFISRLDRKSEALFL
uniref:Uncharacterized protein n=1 Tax=Aegilops tauschii subsp. strangulata TaxID=200361 RepID=A0A453N193_AEGTS